jgi:hypothetical protein
MVKSPRIRHSRSSTDPVTIDLSPGEVSRVKAEAERAGKPEAPAAAERKPGDTSASKPEEVRSDKVADAAAPKPSSPDAGPASGPTGSSTSAAQGPSASPKAPPEPAPKTGTPKAETPKAAAGGFGRNEPPRPAPAQGRGGGVAAGLAGGAVVLAAALALQFAGLWPSPAPVSDEETAGRVAAVESEIDALRTTVAALEEAVADGGAGPDMAQFDQRIAEFSSRIDALEAEIAARPDAGAGEQAGEESALDERIAALEARVGELAGVGDAGEEASRRLDDLAQELGALREADAATGERLDGIDAALAAIDERLGEQVEAGNTALVIAASALKAAIDRGDPFAAELDTFASLAPDTPQIAELRAYAAEGVPTRAAIADGIGAAANAMVEAGREIDPQAGFFDRLWASAQDLVTVRPIGMVEGEDVPARVARIEAHVAADDYDAALAEFAALPDSARAPAQAFMDGLAARAAADGLVAALMADALRA